MKVVAMDDGTLVNSVPADIVIIIRPSLKQACCEGDACRAAIFNQLLYCIAWKRKYDKEYWYGSYEEVYTKLLDESWGLSKVIKETKTLVSQGFIEQRRNPNKGWDQTRQYLFGKEQAEKFSKACEKANVCIQHQIGFPPDVTHLLKITNAISENNKCICSIQQIDSVESTNPSVEINDAIPKIPTKVTQRDERKNGNGPSIHSSTLSSDCLKTVKEFSELYGDSDTALYQELAQRVYQRYEISDSEFHDYLYHAQAASVKTKLMSKFFEELQRMLDSNFKAKGEN